MGQARECSQLKDRQGTVETYPDDEDVELGDRRRQDIDTACGLRSVLIG